MIRLYFTVELRLTRSGEIHIYCMLAPLALDHSWALALFSVKRLFQFKKNHKCPALKVASFGQGLLKQPASRKK